jgi:hypothetical protein
VRTVHGSPALLGCLEQLERHRQPGLPAARPLSL